MSQDETHPNVEKASHLEKSAEDVTTDSSLGSQNSGHLQGLRLHLTTTGLTLALILVNLEVPIVVTSLVGITDSLGGFQKTSWIQAAYLLGYTSFVITFSKFSDIFGRKSCLLLALGIFIVFSAALGAVQTINELIIFRAFQGAGGAGVYSLTTITFFDLIPREKAARYASIVSMASTVALAIGPILGGAISQSSTWRWLFLLNVPAGIFAALVLILSLPNGFPYQNRPQEIVARQQRFSSLAAWQKVDIVGTVSLVIATLSLVAALEEAGLYFPWRSAFVITLLTVSGVAWTFFIFWERSLTLSSKRIEAMFPWRLLQSRVWVGMLLNATFLGATWFTTNFQLPQRMQIVDKISPLQAGIRFLPFTIAAPVGSVVAPIIAKVAKVPLIYLVIFASALQVIGIALLSTLGRSQMIASKQYGFEILAGFGCGISITLGIILTPFSVEARDKATAMGSLTQFRIMGGVLGLAIATSAFNNSVTASLRDILTQSQINDLLRSAIAIDVLPEHIQDEVRVVFADGYDLQMKILAGLAAAQLPASILMWQKKQIRLG